MKLEAEQGNTGCVVAALRACAPHPPAQQSTALVTGELFFPTGFVDFVSDNFEECFPLDSTFSLASTNADLPLSPPASAFCIEPMTKGELVDTSALVAPGTFDFSDLLLGKDQSTTQIPVLGVFYPPLSAKLIEETVEPQTGSDVDLIDINDFLSSFTPPESPCTDVKTEQEKPQIDTATLTCITPAISSPPPLTTSDTETGDIKTETPTPNTSEYTADAWGTCELGDDASDFIDPRLLFSPSISLPACAQQTPGPFLSSPTQFLPTCICGIVGDVKQEREDEDEVEVDVETVDGAPGVTGSDMLKMYVSVAADPTPIFMGHAPVVTPPHPGLMPLPHYVHVNSFFPPQVILAEAKPLMPNAISKSPSKSVSRQNSSSPGPYARRTGKFSKEHRRETHNLLEKKRRDEMKIALDNLAECVPKVVEAQGGSGKIPLMQVLDWSTEHMRWLRQANIHLNGQKQAFLDSNEILLARLRELQAKSA